MSKAFFVIQAITCLCQGFANTSKGSAMTRGTKMIISTIREKSTGKDVWVFGVCLEPEEVFGR